MRWYSIEPGEIAARLDTDLVRGLTPQQVAERLTGTGYNELAKTRKRPPWRMFFDQFRELLVLLLVAAAVVSAAVGEALDAGVILAIVILNAWIGFIQEHRAERSLEALKKLAAPRARVIRAGEKQEIAAREIVPGDLILIEAGDFVPADARLTSSTNLKVDESALTGESEPAEKQALLLPDEEIGVGDRTNQIFMGTTVTYGNGTAVVVATGMRTEIGKIAGMLEEMPREQTPLQRKLEEISKWLGGIAVLLCGVIFGTGILRQNPPFEMFLIAVSLAVAAIPEGLPAVVTMVLALGVQRMARRSAIIRKLPAVETLGSATVICSDKTGTLTKNEMTVRYLFAGGSLVKVSGEGYIPEGKFSSGEKEIEIDPRGDRDLRLLLTIAALANNADLIQEERPPESPAPGNGTEAGGEPHRKWRILGDPTEGALVVAARKAGLTGKELEEFYPRLGEIPFDSERKLMTTIHPANRARELIKEPYLAFTKGAFDIILARSTHHLRGGRILPLTEEIKQELTSQNARLAAQALRVLGMAFRPLGNLPETLAPGEVEQGLVFVGLAAMIDSPRPEAKEAVEVCRRAGIKPVMITGDHRITALAIARELGIYEEGELVLTGTELDRLSDEEFQEQVGRVSVYARVSPEHKVRIVEAFKKKEQVVAMTGDGVNDAPALRRADIGAAMGITGTDVAKEAADMVLADDNFATIVAAVKEGRVIFANIRKTVHYLLSCNSSELMVIFAAIALGLPSPLFPLQILWINLVTDGLPALALGVDPPEAGIMDRAPRSPRAGIFAGKMGYYIMRQGLLIGALSLLAFWLGYQGKAELLAQGRTMAFGTLALAQIVHSFNVRSLHLSLFRIGPWSNKFLVGAAAISGGLQLLAMLFPPFQKIFRTVPLGSEGWLIVAGLSFAPLLFEEMIKLRRSLARLQEAYRH
ncbi:MAG: cation-translocating P-type ATPase [Bacillota bacterium]|nr:cation-translocating P-type ATPase [Bacillota bacterium]